jgi:TrmH family RNA methyltransferase
MFPLKKLGELSPRTRTRKVALILQSVEIDMRRGGGFDPGYLQGLLELLEMDVENEAAPRDAGVRPGKAEDGRLRDRALSLHRSARFLGRALSSGAGTESLLRGINALRNDALAFVGAEPSEWDLLEPRTGALDRTAVRTLPLSAFLEDIRSPFNVGSILRTAEAFGMSRIYLSPRTPLPTHPRAHRTARGAETALPWEISELSTLRGKPGVFALELGGTPMQDFAFPDEGVVLVGSEELGLSPEALAVADAGLGRVSIPLAGAKRSLNVAVAFGILTSRWRAAAEKSASRDHPAG